MWSLKAEALELGCGPATHQRWDLGNFGFSGFSFFPVKWDDNGTNLLGCW